MQDDNTWRALPAGIREILARAFDTLVRRNPLTPGLKKHILAEGLGEERLDRVLQWIGIQQDDPAMARLDRALSFEEQVLLQFAGRGPEDPEALRYGTSHRWEAWSDVIAFSSQAEALARGYGEGPHSPARGSST